MVIAGQVCAPTGNTFRKQPQKNPQNDELPSWHQYWNAPVKFRYHDPELRPHCLPQFEYKTSINGLVFITAGTVAILMSALAVGYESFRAASANPVSVLRTE